jgi:hypothetical protein
MALDFEAAFGKDALVGGPCHYAFAARRGIVIWLGGIASWIKFIKPIYPHN